MSRKREKSARQFIKHNRIILRKFGDWLGCDKNMSEKEIFTVVDDMVERYKEECYTNCFDVQMFGPGKKSSLFKRGGYRNEDFDEDWGVSKPKSRKPQTIEELMDT